MYRIATIKNTATTAPIPAASKVLYTSRSLDALKIQEGKDSAK